MQTVNFVLRNNPNSLTMVFRFHKAAEELYKKALIATGKIEDEDDFGCKLSIDISDVSAVTFSEYEKDMEKNMEFQLIQHKAQLKAQSKARNDVGLQILEQNSSPIVKAN